MIPILDIINPIAAIINKFIPDKDAASKREADLAIAQLSASLQIMQAQADINKVEAASSSVFVAGWRPAAGWVCVAVLALSALVQILLPAVIVVIGHIAGADTSVVQIVLQDLLKIDTSVYLSILGSLLGINMGLRTFEKRTGVSTKELK